MTMAESYSAQMMMALSYSAEMMALSYLAEMMALSYSVEMTDIYSVTICISVVSGQ